MSQSTLIRESAEISALLAELGREARTFRFDIAPNPCVGAAVLSQGRVLGRGFHERWGGPHAEIRAFEAAARSGVPEDEWDTLVVTLEPCSSSGKTPPCVDAVLARGIRRVVCGALDPDPRHRGQGLEKLEAAGVEIVLVRGASPLEDVSPHFLEWMKRERLRRPRPWTIAKWAQTRSGQLTPPPDTGDGRWISCPESLAEVQILRGRVDAILTGVGTVRADDPRFTVRPPGNASNPPARVVLDSFLRTPPTSRLFAAPTEEGEAGGPVHILCLGGLDANRREALTQVGATLHNLHASEERQISLREVQAWCWEKGYRRVLLEAGPTLLSSYFEAGFLDQVRVYTGSINGGEGPSMGLTVANSKLYDRMDGECGEDARFQAFLENPN